MSSGVNKSVDVEVEWGLSVGLKNNGQVNDLSGERRVLNKTVFGLVMEYGIWIEYGEEKPMRIRLDVGC